MRIGELSRRTGASVRSLRYYEQQGLIVATRTPGGHREFLSCAPARVEWIRRLYASGLSSATIAQFLPHMNELTRPSENPQESIPVHVGRELQSEVARIDEAIDELRRSREMLATLAASMGHPVRAA